MGIAKSIKKGVKKVSKGVKKVVKGISKGVKKVVGGIGKAYNKIMGNFGPLGPILAGVAVSFMLPGLGTTMSSAWQGFTGWAANIQNPILNGVMRGVTYIGDTIGSAYSTAKGGLDTLSNKFMSSVKDIAGGITDTVGEWTDGIFKMADVAKAAPEAVANMSGSQILEASASFTPAAEGSFLADASTLSFNGAVDSFSSITAQSSLTSFGEASFLEAAEASMPGLGTSESLGTMDSSWSKLSKLPSEALGFPAPKLNPLEDTLGMMTQNPMTGTYELPKGSYGFAPPEPPPGGVTSLDKTFDWKKAISGIGKGLGVYSGVQPPPVAGVPDPVDMYKMAMGGTGTEGSAAWQVPYLNENMQTAINRMAENYRVYLRGLAERTA